MPTTPRPLPTVPPAQRLQRFSTYGHLKQMVLKMIVDEVQEETMLKQHNWDLAIGGLQVGSGCVRSAQHPDRLTHHDVSGAEIHLLPLLLD